MLGLFHSWEASQDEFTCLLWRARRLVVQHTVLKPGVDLSRRHRAPNTSRLFAIAHHVSVNVTNEQGASFWILSPS